MRMRARLPSYSHFLSRRVNNQILMGTGLEKSQPIVMEFNLKTTTFESNRRDVSLASDSRGVATFLHRSTLRLFGGSFGFSLRSGRNFRTQLVLKLLPTTKERMLCKGENTFKRLE